MNPDLFPYFQAWLEKNGDFDGAFFLDSYLAPGPARYSYFPLRPPKKTFTASSPEQFPKAWDELQKEIANSPKQTLGGHPFTGGAVGVLSYDAGRFFEHGWKTKAPPDSLNFPLMHFGIYRDLVCLDHASGRFHFYAASPSKLKSLQKEFESLSLPTPKIRKHALSTNVPNQNRSWYLEAVGKIKKYISRGDIYQANLSQRMISPKLKSGLEFFSNLRQINPSPYACYFKIGAYEVASCSPELLLKLRGRTLESRPIAGTRPRGKSPESDRYLKGELILNPKERAEHIMLLDLERNDLGRVCQGGSVKVTEKMVIEKYSHVMHIVSHVKGTLKKGEDIFSALAATFPGGTITGCPKIRCMEILDELEPVARGPFFGSAGWIGEGGNAEMNILIRTAVIKEDQIIFQAGSGIVADSEPEKEYQESLQKAKALREAL